MLIPIIGHPIVAQHVVLLFEGRGPAERIADHHTHPGPVPGRGVQSGVSYCLPRSHQRQMRVSVGAPGDAAAY
jgi:hypothetical protein